MLIIEGQQWSKSHMRDAMAAQGHKTPLHCPARCTGCVCARIGGPQSLRSGQEEDNKGT